MSEDTTTSRTWIESYGYGEAGHKYDPDPHGRCRKAAGGYCDGTPTDPQHDDRSFDISDHDGPYNMAATRPEVSMPPKQPHEHRWLPAGLTHSGTVLVQSCRCGVVRTVKVPG